MMLVGTVIIDAGLIVVWLALGIIDGEWDRIPLWATLVACLFSFLQLLISSFLYGVSRQVATSRGADLKELPLDEKLSDTIDEGWTTTLKVAKLSLLVVCAILLGTSIVLFNDLKFLVGFHRGMELNTSGDAKGAQNWFRLSIDSAGPDRIAIARFLLAGSLIRDQKFVAAETELRQAISELDPKNEDNQALLVYIYSALSNCLEFQSKLPESEIWAAKSVQVIEDNPNLLGLRLRLIGPYKQFLIPEAPPLTIALAGLEDIYIKEGNFDLALKTYKRILNQLDKSSGPSSDKSNSLQPGLSADKSSKFVETDIFDELMHFQRQLAHLQIDKTAPVEKKAIAMSVDLSKLKFKTKDVADFDLKYQNYIKELNQKNRR